MPKNIKANIAQSIFAFRGYNVTNLGRTPELLAHPRYAPFIADHLQRASNVCAEVIGVPVDLVARVRNKVETDLSTYHEAIGLIVAVEVAQIQILRELFGIEYAKSRMAYGFSLGEITALVCGGVLKMEDAIRIPLAMSEDCAALANDTVLGILISRGSGLAINKVNQLCLRINNEGRGVVGISCFLSPNSVLLMGQGDTLERFKERLKEISSERWHLRINEDRWPPLHTPIVWERNIPCRSSFMMHTLSGGFAAPQPPVFSLVTGDTSYDDSNAREILGRWVDHPQRLWDAVDRTLSMGVEQVIHVGPQPNIIPATFERLAVDVDAQTRGRFHMRALSGIIRRPWLKAMLPKRAALLRAPLLKQITLEDWLLEHPA